MNDRINLLANILLDDTARDDERDDAALILGQFDDDTALNALMKIATNSLLQDAYFQDVCGESIANILITRNNISLFKECVAQLTPIAKHAANAFMHVEKPEWR